MSEWQQQACDRSGRAPHAAAAPVTMRSWPAAGGGLLVCATAALDAAGSRTDLFLRLGLDDQVSIIVPDAPLDDGAISRVTGIVADELDLPPDKVRTEYGLSRGRSNRPVSLPQYHDVDVEDMVGDCLRMASATIQAMLICAAAETWCVMPRECHVSGGAVFHGPTGRRFRYGVLAPDAALQCIPQRVTLRNGEDRTILRL